MIANFCNDAHHVGFMGGSFRGGRGKEFGYFEESISFIGVERPSEAMNRVPCVYCIDVFCDGAAGIRACQSGDESGDEFVRCWGTLVLRYTFEVTESVEYKQAQTIDLLGGVCPGVPDHLVNPLGIKGDERGGGVSSGGGLP